MSTLQQETINVLNSCVLQLYMKEGQVWASLSNDSHETVEWLIAVLSPYINEPTIERQNGATGLDFKASQDFYDTLSNHCMCF